MHGIVVTYQQAAMQPLALRALAGDAFVILDELHHAGDDRAWGAGIRDAFAQAPRRLALSGTPFRSDTAAIPFVTYDEFGQAHPDYEYGYGQALGDGSVVRPVYFPRIDGHMEWVGPDGTRVAAGFDDPLDAARSAQRLRTALSLGGEWLPAVLDQAHAQLTAIRTAQPHAGGLIIAMDHEHARGIVELMRRRHGVTPTLVLSDDAGASARIDHFAEGSMPWIVAVRMVSEGVDIPRLRVGVFATNTATELFFRQATGRLVRWTRGCATRRPSCSSPTTRGCAPSPPTSPSNGATACAGESMATTAPSVMTRPSTRSGARRRWRSSSRCSRPSPRCRSAPRTRPSGWTRSSIPN